MLNVTDALTKLIEAVTPTTATFSGLSASLGCILAEDVVSKENSPLFDKSMMDGYAVCSQDLQLNEMDSREVELTVIGELTAGQTATRSVQSGTALRIMTGAPIPAGADSVIPVEQSTLVSAERVSLCIQRNVSAGENIIACGQNIRTGERVMRAGQQIRPQEIALLAELGSSEVFVRSQPRVAILATGDELVAIDQTPGPGQIRNSNATMLAAQVRVTGAQATILEIARDKRDDLRAKIEEGMQHDFLCLSGGVSAGVLDLVPTELAAAGVEKIFHKVAMKPGKPIWFGMKNGTNSNSPCYVFGLPGNPVSSMVCFELFVNTALRKFRGILKPRPELLSAVLEVDFQQRGDREVWFPSRIQIDQGKLVVTPTGWKGSSDIRSTVEANCSARFPAGERVFAAGEAVQVLLWSGSSLTPKLRTNES